MAVRLDVGAIPTQLLHHLQPGACHTIDRLAELLPLDRRQISDGMVKLIALSYAERIEIGCYQLTPEGIAAHERREIVKSGPRRPDTGSRKPRRDTMRERAWTAMRMSGTFTIGEIVMAAAREEQNPENNLQRYLRALKAAGYVVELPTRQRGTRLTSNGFKRFRLVKDTGPSAPVFQEARGRLMDFNLKPKGEAVPCSK